MASGCQQRQQSGALIVYPGSVFLPDFDLIAAANSAGLPVVCCRVEYDKLPGLLLHL